MKEMNEKIKVNELIQVCKDASRGFRLAAGEVDSRFHQVFLQTRALERGDFVRDLQNAALKLGLVPTRDGSLLGTVHRTWMNLRHHLNPHKDQIPLLECRRGEEHALKLYEEVIDNHLLPQIQPALEEQFVAMIETRDMLRNGIAGTKDEDISGSVLHLL